MVQRYVIPTGDPNQVKDFTQEIVQQLQQSPILETEGVILASDDVEVVIGTLQSAAFQDKSIVDDVSLHMTPIIYELLGYLTPNLRYMAVSEILPGTVLCRVLHVRGEIRNPLYAINMTPMPCDGYWRDIDMTQPSSLAPTLELMGIESGQQTPLKGELTDLDHIDLRKVNMWELSRVSSLLEMVMRKGSVTMFPPEPVVDHYREVIAHYRNDSATFKRVMRLARGIFGLSFWVTLMHVKNDLIFGNLSPGGVDRFIEAMGVSADLKAVRLLKVSRYHRASASLQIFQPYFDHHQVIPFLIDWNQAVQDAILNKGCELLCTPVTTP